MGLDESGGGFTGSVYISARYDVVVKVVDRETERQTDCDNVYVGGPDFHWLIVIKNGRYIYYNIDKIEWYTSEIAPDRSRKVKELRNER